MDAEFLLKNQSYIKEKSNCAKIRVSKKELGRRIETVQKREFEKILTEGSLFLGSVQYSLK